MMDSHESDAADDYVVVDHSDVNVSTNQESPETITKIKEWLKPTDSDSPASEYRKHLNSHAKGTSEWILETRQYREWSQSDSVGNLWIRGIPGCGKSVVAASMIDRLQRLGDGPVLFFFFREIIQTNRTPRSAVQDFCHKLIDKSPSLQSELKQHRSKFSSIESVPFDTLWNSLSSALKFAKKIYCVVDALDEMDSGHDQFVQDLLSLGRQYPHSIKLIVTSRQVPHLEKYMSGASLVDLRLDRRNVDHDISIFISQRLRDSDLELPPDKIENIQKAICERGKGLFLYARLMLNQLLLNSDDLSNNVDNLPDGLGDMYTNLLRDHAKRSNTSREFQGHILLWITHSARPLRLLELASMIEGLPDRGSLEPGCNVKLAIRTSCGPLLEVCEDGVIQIIHHSLTEFILNRDVEHTQMANLDRDFAAVDSSAVHSMIARTCLRYLSSGTLRQWNTNGSNKNVRTALLLEHYFLNYAITEWPFHVVKSAESDIELLELIRKFCDDGSHDYEAWKDLWSQDHEAVYKKDFSPLHLAAYCGMTEFARHLLSMGADPESSDNEGKTPLVYAVMKGHDRLVTLLLQHNADHSIRLEKGQSLVHYACKLNHLHVIRALIQGGADPMVQDGGCRGCGGSYYCEILDKSFYYHSCRKNHTPLAWACEDGHVEVVGELMKHLGTADLCNGYLHIAAQGSQTEVVRVLLQHEGVRRSINERDLDGNTPLYLAARARCSSTIGVLLDHGADVQVLSANRNYPPEPPIKQRESTIECIWPPSYTPLHGFAIGIAREEHELFFFDQSWEKQDVEGSLEALLKAGSDINARDRRGRTPLFGWARIDWMVMRSKDFVKLLLDKGADPTVIDYEGSSLLHPKNARIWDEELRLFTDAGVDINLMRQQDGKTPLMLTALEQNHIDPRLFRERGADFDIQDFSGNTALHHYFRREPPGSNCWLDSWLSLSNLQIRNQLGRTPLHELVYRQGRFPDECLGELLQKMLQHGASLESRDQLGRTAILIALNDRQGASLKVIDELLNLGADATVVDLKGKTTLHYAFKSFNGRFARSNDDCCRIPKRLIDSGANIRAIDHDGNTIFHDIIEDEPIWQLERWAYLEKRAKALIDMGAPFRQANHQGRSALHVAAGLDIDPGYSGTGPILTRLEFLLQNSLGFDVNAGDNEGITPLHLASAVSDTNTLIIIENGANIHVTDHYGRTPLHFAARAGQSNVVGLLAEIYDHQSMSVDNACAKGRTPLHEASLSGCLEAVNLLLEAGANVSLQDERGRTALHAAAEFEYSKFAMEGNCPFDSRVSLLTEPKRFQSRKQNPISEEKYYIWIQQVVRSLLNAGANIHQRDTNGQSPLDVAITLGCSPVIDELQYVLQQSGLRATKQPAVLPLNLNGVNLQEIVHAIQIPDDGAWFLQRLFSTCDDRLAEEIVRCKFPRLARDIIEPSLFQLARWGLTSMLERILPYVDDWQALTPALLGHAADRPMSNLEMVRFLASILSDEHKQAVTTTRTIRQRGRGRGASRSRGRGGGLGHHSTQDIETIHPLAAPLIAFSAGKRWWHPKALSILLEAGVNPAKSFRNNHDRTNLLQVSLCPYRGTSNTANRCKWNIEVLKVLLKRGLDLHHVESGHSWTPLVAAIRGSSDLEIIRLLIDHGASISHGSPSPITVAIQENNLAVVELLLKAGVDPNGTEDECPLLEASQTRDNGGSAMSLLLQYGADPLHPMEDGTSTVFHEMCDFHNGRIYRMVGPILAAGVDLNSLDSQGRSPLIRASNSPCSEETQAALQLIRAGADLHIIDQSGSTALHYAAKSGNVELVETLLMHNVTVDQRNLEGMTPLCCALDSYALKTYGRSRFYLIIQQLVESGTELLQILPDGRTALHCIAEVLMDSSNVSREDQIEHDGGADHFTESTNLYELFLAAGCDREACDNEGNTPIFKYVAAKKPWCGEDQWVPQPRPPNPEDYKKMFAEHDIRKTNNHGDTLLHTIARRERCESDHDDGEELFAVLVEMGLNPWQENKQGQTALDIAATSGKKGILALFARDE